MLGLFLPYLIYGVRIIWDLGSRLSLLVIWRYLTKLTKMGLLIRHFVYAIWMFLLVPRFMESTRTIYASLLSYLLFLLSLKRNVPVLVYLYLYYKVMSNEDFLLYYTQFRVVWLEYSRERDFKNFILQQYTSPIVSILLCCV